MKIDIKLLQKINDRAHAYFVKEQLPRECQLGYCYMRATLDIFQQEYELDKSIFREFETYTNVIEYDEDDENA